MDLFVVNIVQQVDRLEKNQVHYHFVVITNLYQVDQHPVLVVVLMDIQNTVVRLPVLM
jgi:hypothetical protein